MRRTALVTLALVGVVLLAGCASTDDAPSAHVPTPSTSLPTGTVATYAPDPDRATVQSSWAFDVTDPAELVRHSDSIVVARVVSIDARGTFEFAKGASPKSGVSLTELRGLKGDVPRDGRVWVSGGSVTLAQVFESDPPESSEKSGIAAMGEQERASTIVEYVTGDPVNLQAGNEYLFMLSSPEEPDIWAVAADGFGVFDVVSNGFENRLTGRIVSLAELQDLIRTEQ